MLDNDELDLAQRIRLSAKRSASKVKGYYWAKMNPKDIPWWEGAELVSAAEEAAWCIGWLLTEIKRLKEFEKFYNDLNDHTAS